MIHLEELTFCCICHLEEKILEENLVCSVCLFDDKKNKIVRCQDDVGRKLTCHIKCIEIHNEIELYEQKLTNLQWELYELKKKDLE